MFIQIQLQYANEHRFLAKLKVDSHDPSQQAELDQFKMFIFNTENSSRLTNLSVFCHLTAFVRRW